MNEFVQEKTTIKGTKYLEVTIFKYSNTALNPIGTRYTKLVFNNGFSDEDFKKLNEVYKESFLNSKPTISDLYRDQNLNDYFNFKRILCL